MPHPLEIGEILIQCPPNIPRTFDFAKLCVRAGDRQRAITWYRDFLRRTERNSMWERKRTEVHAALARLG